MAAQNFPDRVLYNMDNLDVLRGMNDETVDLIATDPPFNKKRNRAASAGQYEDAWRWADDPSFRPSFRSERPDQRRWQPVHGIWLDQIADANKGLAAVIAATKHTQDDDTAAFLCFLGVRLLEMHRVLKPTGSIYLHCDHSANAYIRMVMDAVFGDSNFRNEIVWKRSLGAKNAARRYHSEHDAIFYYAKSRQFTWNPVYMPLSPEVIDAWYRYTDENGERYNVGNLQAPGAGGYEYEFLGVTRKWRHPERRMRELLAQGRIVHKSTVSTSRREVAGIKRYLRESKGALVGDIWQDIKLLGRRAREAAGSPDQKPVALYERIIAASSNPGDIVLDPFCGCATTPIAAQNLGRRWVGIDRREDAAYHIVNRLLGLGINVNEFKARQQALMLEIQAACEIRYIPPVRTDDGDTAPRLGPVYRRRKPAPATMTRAAMLDILAAQWGLRCWGCGFEPPSVEFLDLDHILPASEGGGNELENRAPLCGPCNKRKSNTMTLTALRRDNRRANRWYGHPAIEERIELRMARQWALDYLAAPARVAAASPVPEVN